MAKSGFTLLLFAATTFSNVLAQAFQGQSQEETINWPEEYEPSRSKFYVHNEIDVHASPQTVWEILIDAESWPQWYEGASDVALSNADHKVLQSESVFTWKTMGLKFETVIKEFVPYTRLSWESKKKSIRAYHAWLIIPTENGCKVITDESQNGWLTFLEKTFQGKKLYKIHEVWLSELKKKAEEHENQGNHL